MTNEFWEYLRTQAVKRNERFIRCDGVVYEVTKRHYASGISPLYSIEEVRPVDVPPFITIRARADKETT